MSAVISSVARCHHHDSVTIDPDRPAVFGRLMAQDRAYFDAEWA